MAELVRLSLLFHQTITRVTLRFPDLAYVISDSWNISSRWHDVRICIYFVKSAFIIIICWSQLHPSVQVLMIIHESFWSWQCILPYIYIYVYLYTYVLYSIYILLFHLRLLFLCIIISLSLALWPQMKWSNLCSNPSRYATIVLWLCTLLFMIESELFANLAVMLGLSITDINVSIYHAWE